MVGTRSSKDPIGTALAPLLERWDRWTLHFPMYINTFCLAYHLAERLPTHGCTPPEIEDRFVSDDWWRGRPTFMYRTDIEIFVAVDSTIELLKAQGHEGLRTYRFTNYAQKHIFWRDNRPSGTTSDPLVITDVPQTVDRLLESWTAKPPAWPDPSIAGRLKRKNVRNSWTRGIGDLFDKSGKLYVFSAPLTQILLSRVDSDDKAKYTRIDVDTPPTPTYYVLRCSAGVSKTDADRLIGALRAYYRLVFDKGRNRKLIDRNLPHAYARLALSGGQPNPFPEVYPGSPQKPTEEIDRNLAERYADILDRHHVASWRAP